MSDFEWFMFGYTLAMVKCCVVVLITLLAKKPSKRKSGGAKP